LVCIARMTPLSCTCQWGCTGCWFACCHQSRLDHFICLTAFLCCFFQFFSSSQLRSSGADRLDLLLITERPLPEWLSTLRILQPQSLTKDCLTACQPCNRELVNYHAWRQHSLARHRDLHCEVCNTFFQSATGLWQHKQTSYAFLDCFFVGCKFRSRSHDEIDAHCNRNHGYCHICGIFVNNNHFQQLHHGCSTCGKCFGDDNQLIKVCLHAI
jgi:hypothetical protein